MRKILVMCILIASATMNALAVETPDIKFPDKEMMSTLAGAGIFLGIILVIALIVYIYFAICLLIISKKTNTRFGWLAWIPIGRLFLMCNIGKVSWKWLIPSLISYFFLFYGIFYSLGAADGIMPFNGDILNLVFWLYNAFLNIFLWYNAAIACGKPGWIGILIFIPILGTFIIPGYLAFSKKEEKAAPAPNIGGGQPA